MKRKLLPCPFCGGKAKIHYGSEPTQGAYDKTAYVACTSCQCRTDEEIEWGNDYIGVVVSLWNRRVATPDVTNSNPAQETK